MASLHPKTPGAKKYRISYWLDGKQKTKILPNGINLQQAQYYLSVFTIREFEHNNGIKSFEDVLDSSQKISDFREWFFKHYVLAKNTGQKPSHNTIQTYKAAFKHLIKACGDCSVDQINITALKKHFASFKPNSISILVRSLRSAWNLGIEMNRIRDNPFTNFPLSRKIVKTPDYWTDREMDCIFEHLPDKARAGFIFGRYAGLRKVELCRNVRWENCLWDEGYGVIDRPKVEASGIDTSRFFITNQLKSAIEHYRKKEGFICDLRYDHLNRLVTKARIQAGITTEGSVKILRHSLARNLLLSGKDIFFVKEILRHADISTTQIYLCFKPKAISDFISS